MWVVPVTTANSGQLSLVNIVALDETQGLKDAYLPELSSLTTAQPPERSS